MALPIRTRPSFSLSQSIPSRSFHNPLILLHQKANRLKPKSLKTTTNLITWTKPCLTMPCRATQDWRVMVESSNKMCFAGERNGKPIQYSFLENPINSMKRQKDKTLKDELPRSLGAQYATGDQWRNNSRKNEETEPKQKHHPAVDVTGGRSKVQCCKEQHW